MQILCAVTLTLARGAEYASLRLSYVDKFLGAPAEMLWTASVRSMDPATAERAEGDRQPNSTGATVPRVG
ncbi:hypothetical protein A6A22_13570 [Arthrobacter sp. OY3WO11]|nr:hypothetical protein A6A22_13570 [Arthrobacter sp. OY3WO11]